MNLKNVDWQYVGITMAVVAIGGYVGHSIAKNKKWEGNKSLAAIIVGSLLLAAPTAIMLKRNQCKDATKVSVGCRG